MVVVFVLFLHRQNFEENSADVVFATNGLPGARASQPMGLAESGEGAGSTPGHTSFPLFPYTLAAPGVWPSFDAFPRSACVLFICGAESQFLSAQNPRGAWPLCAKWDESFQDEPEWRGSKAPSQNPCLKFLHGLLQEPLPSKKMDFKGDVCGQQLGSSKTLPRTLSSPPQLESLGGDTQTGLIKESEMCSGSSMTSSQADFSLGSVLVSIP